MEKKPELKTNAAPFVVKTYALLENPAYQSIVSWTPSGESFAIHNTDEMANKVLPAYFKSQNLCSFIRQLNTYGFSKVDGPLRLEFKHENFQRKHPEKMGAIMRRKSVKRETEDQHIEDRKVAAPTPTTTPRSPDGSENGGEPHRSPPFSGEAASPAAAQVAAAPATALLAEQNNQIAQIGSILQKILVELERVKREQSTLREAVAGIQQQQLQQLQHQQQQQPLLHATVPQPSQNPSSIAPSLLTMAKVRSEPELLDVIADMHRTTLETEPNWEFDQPIPIDELLGEVLQLPQTPAANGPVHQQ